MLTARTRLDIARYRRFSREEIQQKGLRWVTLKNRQGEATTHVLIDGHGSVHVGPKGMVGHALGEHHSHTQSPRRHPAKPQQRMGPGIMSVDDIHVDPERFQYKISGINKATGTNAELKKVREYNPMLGGQLLVWEDPANRQTYVVNGHHRLELAKRSPRSTAPGKFSGSIPVYHIDAPDAKTARAYGAMANIAEGRGTATDAAKFMRDMEVDLPQLADMGISPTGAVASTALDLKKLSPHLFQKLTNGLINERRGATIGRHVPSHDAQDQLAKWLEQREKPGKEFSESKVAEMGRLLASQRAQRVNAGGGMFDDWFDQYPVEQRADITDFVRRNLSSESRTLKDASSTRRKKTLEASEGNRLDIEGNKARAKTAEQRVEEFDHRANAAGHPVALMLDEYANRLMNEPRKRNALMLEALDQIRRLTDVV